MESNIYLIGFMGAGKSTVGRLLAERLNRKFVDLDTEIELRFQKSIPRIFAEEGENSFRNHEEILLDEILKQEKLVAALGGGAFKEKLHNFGTVIYLKAPFEVLLKRIKGTDRPLAREAKKLYLERVPLYETAAIQIDTGDKTPEKIVNEIIQRITL